MTEEKKCCISKKLLELAEADLELSESTVLSLYIDCQGWEQQKLNKHLLLDYDRKQIEKEHEYPKLKDLEQAKERVRKNKEFVIHLSDLYTRVNNGNTE
jgi:Cdc6-like AAA superfamily ATPase